VPAAPTAAAAPAAPAAAAAPAARASRGRRRALDEAVRAKVRGRLVLAGERVGERFDVTLRVAEEDERAALPAARREERRERARDVALKCGEFAPRRNEGGARRDRGGCFARAEDDLEDVLDRVLAGGKRRRPLPPQPPPPRLRASRPPPRRR
jgi:hypothetical protein